MPRENSFSDSEGRSITPDPEDFHVDVLVASPVSPSYSHRSGYVPQSASSAGNVSPKAAENTRSHTTPLSHRAFHASSAHSRQLHINTATTRSEHALHRKPLDRFRAAVHKVIAMHRGTSAIVGSGRSRIGAEPGVDPRRSSANAFYSQIENDCQIEVVDYSSVRSVHRSLNKFEFIEFMDSDGGVPLNSPVVGQMDDPTRAPWVRVRWINIGGISWTVMKALALRYNLHPLALEDIFHGHARNRSKADYYAHHLMIHILCHELDDDSSLVGGVLDGGDTSDWRTSSPLPMNHRMPKVQSWGNEKHSSLKFSPKHKHILPFTRDEMHAPTRDELERIMTKEHIMRATKQNIEQQERSIEAMKADDRVNVRVSPMFLFLLRDGTVLSVHSVPDLKFTSPITRRLRSRDTMLRKSADPSLLIHSLLDLIVDRSLEVVDEYHRRIIKHEHDILLHASSKRLRQLHILSGDLILHQRTLDPIKTLIYGLRRYDLDRCAALIDTSDSANKDVKVVGFMSHTAKIYLADVYDHMEYILTSLNMYSNITENLINYSFNVASYEMNNTMRLLTLVTIIFLPLTLLTGYFGMNFKFMWSVNNHSDLLFWEIAIPILLVTVPVAMLVDIQRFWHYMQKKYLVKTVLSGR
ncbi:hypothetical protein BJ165DRAFT_443374 [Panaeolus papilionaceus]|nr:hypothetical protein BJ165DRAFT_443374 [Panaeolus papilionaceus]